MNKFIKFLLAFKYAFAGIWAVLKKERNLKIHFAAAILVILVGLYFGISRFEWLVLVLTIMLVFSLEIGNSAIETAIDLACPKRDPKAKFAKDAAAGAVLVAAIGALIIGAIIFLDRCCFWALTNVLQCYTFKLNG